MEVRQRRGKKTSGKPKAPESSAKKAVASAMTLSQVAFVSMLIFGGCCSNVITLESIVHDHPNSGQLVTFVQFLIVSLEGLFYFFDSSSKFLIKKPKVPLHMWTIPVALYFSISVLNNMVWAYDVSIPIHIIFRSGGTVTTMIVGYLFMGKRYSKTKVLAVSILTVGVILATTSTASGSDTQKVKWDSRFGQGIAILFLAAVLASFQGLVAEKTYAKYGKHWRENLFYTHFLSLALFIPILPQMVEELKLMSISSPSLFNIPKQYWLLLLNGFTQYICVRGVNNLAGHTSALTVTVFLNVRKFVSLILSAILFGNSLSNQGIGGAVLVFIGAILYSYY